MESKELLTAIRVLADSNNSSFDDVKSILETAMATSLNKNFGEDFIASVEIKEDGSYDVYQVPLIEDEPEYKNKEKVDIKLKRNNFQVARQQLFQKMKEHKKINIEQEYSDYFNAVHYVKVVSQDKRGFFVEFSRNLEGYLPKNDLPRGEHLKVGSRVYALLKKDTKYKQHPFVFTRKGKDFVWQLISKEDDNVQSGIIKNMGMFREEGYKSVVVVKSTNNTIDPFFSIVGHKGVKIKSINDALGRENLTVIRWHEDPIEQIMEYIRNSRDEIMPSNITIDEKSKVINLSYEPEFLDKLKNNKEEKVLNDILPTWTIKIDAGDNKESLVFNNLVSYFSQALNVDDELAEAIVSSGYTNIDDFADSSIDDVSDIGIDDEDSETLIETAKQYIVNKKLEYSEELAIAEKLSLPITYIEDFASCGINNIEALAEHSTDELSEETKMIHEEELPIIIMKARKELGWI